MSIDSISNPLISFAVRVIDHKFFQYSRINNVSCMVVDLGYKIVKKDHTYDLADLQLQQLFENLEAIRKNKSTSCKFFSLLVCILFYVYNTFPTFGKFSWKTNRSIIV